MMPNMAKITLVEYLIYYKCTNNYISQHQQNNESKEGEIMVVKY